ncbi:hypothetical protein Goarm_010969 [Gossypium armourianum]|uniref:RNase H type-1 domain-containing protein n=1 Tax=Gossypium armourianum TaxID=34283 RepID=A0A7J9IVF3_9ROSI|nr:hypothetical protein [Gossypium armourianum]
MCRKGDRKEHIEHALLHCCKAQAVWTTTMVPMDGVTWSNFLSGLLSMLNSELSPNCLRMEDGGDVGMRGGLSEATRWKPPPPGWLSIFERVTFRPQLAEAFTIREALLWLKSNHYNHIIVGSDCALVVHALDRSIVDDSKFDCFISDCLMLRMLDNRIWGEPIRLGLSVPPR